MATKVIKNEFKLKNFCYNHPDTTVFHRYQWICWDAEHLILRAVLAVYIIYAYIHEVVHNCSKPSDHDNNTTNNSSSSNDDTWEPRRQPYASFEMWCFTVLLVHLVYQCCLSFYFTLKNRNVKLVGNTESSNCDQNAEGKSGMSETSKRQLLKNAKDAADDTAVLAWYFKLSWLLCDIILPTAPLVTIIYFGALHEGSVDVFTVNIYIMNTVLVFMDQVISARPVRLLHFVAPVIFTFVYTVFNYAYWKNNNKEDVVYPGVLDWSSSGQATAYFFLFTLVMIPISLTFWFIFYRIKLFTYAWRYQK